MTDVDMSEMRQLYRHLKDRALRCRTEAVSTEAVSIENVYYKHHLLGRASAFDDAAWMIMERCPGVND